MISVLTRVLYIYYVRGLDVRIQYQTFLPLQVHRGTQLNTRTCQVGNTIGGIAKTIRNSRSIRILT